MKTIVLALTGFLASLLYIYILFSGLRRLNYKEERVFDLIFANLICTWVVIYLQTPWLFIFLLLFDFWFILKQSSWNIVLTFSNIFQAHLVFFALYLAGGFYFFGFSPFVIPLSVAFLIIYVLLSRGNEVLEDVYQKVTLAFKKRRKQAY